MKGEVVAAAAAWPDRVFADNGAAETRDSPGALQLAQTVLDVVVHGAFSSRSSKASAQVGCWSISRRT